MILSRMLTAVLLSAAVLGAADGKYSLNLRLIDDTPETGHLLDFSSEYFNALKISTNSEYTAKDQFIQKKAVFNATYSVSDRLNMGCQVTGAENTSATKSINSNNYNLNGMYRPSKLISFRQTLGGISEKRLGLEDAGVRYNSSATLTLPEKKGTAMDFTLGTAGNNLEWGKWGYNAGGNVSLAYTEGSAMRISAGHAWNANRDVNIYSEEQYSYVINTLNQHIDVSTDYDLGKRMRVVFKGGYKKDDVRADDTRGAVSSVNYRGDELKAGMDLVKGDFRLMEMKGDFLYKEGSRKYEDENRNEKTAGYSAGSEILMRSPVVDSMRITGNLEKNSLFDNDGQDDRDDLSVKTSVTYPFRILPRLGCRMMGNVYVTKTVYLNPAKSINSKWSKVYRVSPKLTYRLSPDLSLSQSYVLSAHYQENIAKQLYDDVDVTDRLYRTFTLRNTMSYMFSERNRFDVDYDYGKVNNCHFEGGLFETDFIRDTYRIESSHEMAVRISFGLSENILLRPDYSMVHVARQDVDDDEKGERTTTTNHTGQLGMVYQGPIGIQADVNLKRTIKLRDGSRADTIDYLTVKINVPLL